MRRWIASTRRSPCSATPWRLDFVAAENSMGFHAPAETARILAESIDFARQGERLARAVAPGPAGAR
jgi:nitrite reductase (cytochrome c-552)